MKLENILDYIENNIRENLTLESLSSKFTISQFHFHRSFKELTGENLIDYINKRRLTLASFDLVDTNKRIIDIALDACYSSQATFTRAFKNYFKMSPGKYRRDKTDRIMLVKTRISIKNKNKINSLNYRLTTLGELNLIGLSCTTTDKEDREDAVIPKLWDRFYSILCQYKYIPKYHRCFDYAKTINRGQNQSYSLLASIDKNVSIPKGLEFERVPESKYIVFKHYGELSNIGDTFQAIENYFYPKTKLDINFLYSLTLYNKDAIGDYFRPGIQVRHFKYDRKKDMRINPNYSAEIYIPLNK